MLVEFIIDHFSTYFEQDPDHNTILWFDPQREWEGLLPYLQPHLLLLVFEGSQLYLRHQLVNRSPGERFVVYLPMKQEEAVYMRPFFYTAKIYDRSIETTLRDQGICPIRHTRHNARTSPSTAGVGRRLGGQGAGLLGGHCQPGDRVGAPHP
jgi:hypothetical protein